MMHTVPYRAANDGNILHAFDDPGRIITKGKPRAVITRMAEARTLLLRKSTRTQICYRWAAAYATYGAALVTLHCVLSGALSSYKKRRTNLFSSVVNPAFSAETED